MIEKKDYIHFERFTLMFAYFLIYRWKELDSLIHLLVVVLVSFPCERYFLFVALLVKLEAFLQNIQFLLKFL